MGNYLLYMTRGECQTTANKQNTLMHDKKQPETH